MTPDALEALILHLLNNLSTEELATVANRLMRAWVWRGEKKEPA